MKKSELTFSALLVPIDYMMIVAAGWLAYYLRFSSAFTELREVFYELPFAEYFTLLLIVGAVWLVIFAISGLYIISGRRLVDELAKIFIACSTGIMLIIILTFFQRELFSSRFIILAGWVLSIVTVSFGRMAIRAIQHGLYKNGIGLHSIALIGSDKNSDVIVNELSSRPARGYRIIDRFKQFDGAVLDSLKQRVQQQRLDEVILTDTSSSRDQKTALRTFCDVNHVTFKYAADLLDAQSINLDINTIAGIPIIEIKRTPLDGWGRILKRVFDVIGASLLIIILSPLLLVIAWLIKIDSRGPAVVKLKRIGVHGRPFTLFKFRSMIDNAHAMKKELLKYNERGDGPLFKMKEDPRVTRIGKFIRRTSIDELLQFFNVLAGHMSLVGPRPHEPEEVARYQDHHRKLLTIKPGVTGMAQIAGRSDLEFEDEAKLDTFYIEHWSFRLDMQILLKTPRAVISPRQAG